MCQCHNNGGEARRGKRRRCWGNVPNRPVPFSPGSMRTVFFGLLGMRAIAPDMAGREPLILGFLVLGFFARVACAFRGLGAGWSWSLSASLAASLMSSSDATSPFSASSSPSASSSFRLRFDADAASSGAYLAGALTTRPDRRRASGSGDAVALVSIVSSRGDAMPRWLHAHARMPGRAAADPGRLRRGRRFLATGRVRFVSCSDALACPFDLIFEVGRAAHYSTG